jgi:hypothetical protein
MYNNPYIQGDPDHFVKAKNCCTLGSVNTAMIIANIIHHHLQYTNEMP